jgi:hypothetical protein
MVRYVRPESQPNANRCQFFSRFLWWRRLVGWFLQTPSTGGPKLIGALASAAKSAESAGGAFAFATSSGVNLFFADPLIAAVAASGELTLIVGMDAITDQAALNALTAWQKKLPGLKPLAFLNTSKDCFHPKTIWFDRGNDGVVVTGSGNLTGGGLQANWEAFEFREVPTDELKAVRKSWADWLKEHSSNLRPIDDPAVAARAKTNKLKAVRIAKASKVNPEDAAEIDAEIEAAIELETETAPATVLIAEVPKSGNRWKQINFDLNTYQNYFGVKLGKPKHVVFYHIQPGGTLGAPENRVAVDVKSQNYRFEVGAAAGQAYPTNGNPIVIFDRIANDTYRYLLLMPSDAEHPVVQNFLNTNFVRKNGQKLRVVIDRADLKGFWPTHPFT